MGVLVRLERMLLAGFLGIFSLGISGEGSASSAE